MAVNGTPIEWSVAVGSVTRQLYELHLALDVQSWVFPRDMSTRQRVNEGAEERPVALEVADLFRVIDETFRKRESMRPKQAEFRA